MGQAGCYSFFPSKNLGCFGDGGMVVTNDASLAEKMRVLRVHGARKKYVHTVVGGNFRLDTLQAAVLSVKLRYLDEWNAARRARAATYRRLISARALRPTVSGSRRSCRAGCTSTTSSSCGRSERDRLLEAFKANGIGSAVYYPLGMHMQECFRGLGYQQGEFPATEEACLTTCALPMFPELTEEQQQRVVAVMAQSLVG